MVRFYVSLLLYDLLPQPNQKFNLLIMKAIQANTKRIAVFFDGTGNNKTNSGDDPAKFGNRTNIAKLFDACHVSDRLYVEGVGTLDNKEDSSFAKATGNNPIGYSGYSYTDKLNKGMSYFKELRQNNPGVTLEFLIFGFSRGATLARDFAKRVLADSQVKIAYLGIMDTVVSLLTVNVSIHFTNSELNRIDQILHLCAINECRYYFPLTSILSAEDLSAFVTLENHYTEKVKEIYVPGAHADLGGGYVSDVENVYLNEIRAEEVYLANSLSIIKTTAKDNLSCSIFQPIWESLMGSNVSIKPYTTLFNLVSERQRVRIELAFTYLETMVTIVNTYFNSTIFTYQSYVQDEHLLQLRNDIVHYVSSNVPLKGPCYNYSVLTDFTHISANFGKEGTGVNNWLNAFDPDELAVEIQSIKNANPTLTEEVYDVNYICTALGLPSLFVNAPANGQWFREVHYGGS